MTRRRQRKKPDRVDVQIALKIRAPEGVKITKKVLDQIVQRMSEGKKLPKNVEVRGIFWRNPDRKGKLAAWRYHRGADLSAAPAGARESRPRPESLQDAIESLAFILMQANISF